MGATYVPSQITDIQNLQSELNTFLTGETLGMKLRRLQRTAKNPFDRLWMQPDQAWQPSTAYQKYDHCVNGGIIYLCQVAGTSASSGGPTGTGTGISDGTVGWDYYGSPNLVVNGPLTNYAAWAASTSYTLGTQVNKSGQIYTCVIAGTSGSTGPTGTSGVAITDGTCTWSYYGSATANTAVYDAPSYTFTASLPSGLTNVYSLQKATAAQALEVFIENGGANYSATNHDTVTFTATGATSALVLTVTSVGAGGAITGVSITNAGNYQTLPATVVGQNYSISPVSTTGSGSGAAFFIRWTDPYWCRLRNSFLTGANGGGIIASAGTFQTTPLGGMLLPRCVVMEFVTDAPKLYITCGTGTPNRFNVTIDNMDGNGGVAFSRAPVTYASGGSAYHVYDFTNSTGRRLRKWRIESIDQWGPSGVAVDTSSQIFPPVDDIPFTVAANSDSIWNGSAFGPHLVGGTVANQLSLAMGWSNMWDGTQGGTGAINRGTGAGVSTDCFVTRILQLMTAGPNLVGQNTGPNLWLLMGSTNDNAYSQAQIKAAHLSIYQTIRGTNPAWTASTAYSLAQVVKNGSNLYVVTTAGTSASSGGPTGAGVGITDGSITWNYLGPVGFSSSAPIVVFGVWSINDTAFTTKNATTETQILAAINAMNDSAMYFIPITNDPYLPWITGTWNNSANTNSTNATAYIDGSDNLHPIDHGTAYLVSRLTQYLNSSILPVIK